MKIQGLYKRIVLVIATIFIVFGSLQLDKVQRKLLYLFNDASFNFSYDKLSGVFPINFCIKGIRATTNQYKINVSKANITLDSSSLKMKWCKIENIKIKAKWETKLHIDDLKILIPVIYQEIIHNCRIDKLDINGTVIHNTYITKCQDCRQLSLQYKDNAIKAAWKIDKKKIDGTVSMAENKISVIYDKTSGNLIVRLNEITLTGKISDNTVTGVIGYNGIKSDAFITHDNEFLKIKLRNKNFGITGSVDFDIDTLKAKIYDINFRNFISVNPIEIDRNLKISDFSIMFSDEKRGKIDFSAINLSRAKFYSGKFICKDVDISQLEKISDLFKGLKGTANGKGSFTNSVGKFEFTIKGFEYKNINIPKIDITSEQSLEKNITDINFEIMKKQQKIHLVTNMRDLSTAFNMIGSVSIKKYKIAKGQIIQGDLKYNVEAKDITNQPIFNGKIILDRGMYVNLYSGTYIRDIQLLGQLQNNEILIKKLYAMDDSKIGGTISGIGNMRYEGKKLNTNVKLKIDKFKIIDQRWLKARLFGDIVINGNLLDEIKVNGNLYTKDPSIDISSIVMLSMRSTDLIATKKPNHQSLQSSFIKIPTNITFSVKPSLSIVGFGLKSVWDANAKISGDLVNPQYTLSCMLQEGKIELTDNKFKLKDGKIIVNNDDMKLYVSSEKPVDKITVGAKFKQEKGTSTIDFYSHPYMSDKDVMSYILFDKNASEISVGETLSLFGIMSKLTGGANLNILGKMKTIFGLDSISIKKNKDSSGNEYDAVSIGKKIGKFKVSVDQATGKDGTNVVVETDVAKNTKIAVDLSSKDSVECGVLWSRRY